MADTANTVQMGLRVRETMRQRLHREAKKNQCSINAEINRRIEQSFEAGARRSLEDVATDMASTWSNWKAEERNIRRMCDAWIEKTGKREKASA